MIWILAATIPGIFGAGFILYAIIGFHQWREIRVGCSAEETQSILSFVAVLAVAGAMMLMLSAKAISMGIQP